MDNLNSTPASTIVGTNQTNNLTTSVADFFGSSVGYKR